MKQHYVILLTLPVLIPILNSLVDPQEKSIKQPPSYHDDFQNRTVILGHRGSRFLGPENTIHMHKWAWKLGADVLEFDVRLTKDNKLVVFHDDRVDRTTNGEGFVSNFTLAELQQLDAGYRYSPKMNGTFQTVTNESTIFPFRGRGLRIPSLSEFLDAFPNHPKNIEIKDNSVVAAEMLWRELKLKGEKILKRVIVSCRFAEPLQHFRRLSNHKVATSASEPEVIKIVVLAKLHISNLWYLYDTLPKSLVALQIPTQSGVLRLDQHHIVNAIHKLGLRVHYWVVNNPQEMARLIEMGVDGIITDRSDLASQLLRRHLRGQQLLDERMSLSLIDLPIEKSFINSTEGFFIPEYLEPELHTCVSLLCRILQNVYYYIFSFVGILTLVVILLWRCK